MNAFVRKICLRKIILLSLLFFMSNVLIERSVSSSLFAGTREVNNILMEQYGEGILSYHDYLVYQGYAYFAPDRLREVYPQAEGVFTSHCATPMIVELHQNWNILSPTEQREFQQFFERPFPRPPHNMVTPSGYFKVHWFTTGGNAVPNRDENDNGLPDMVDAAVEAADLSFNTFRGLGYKDPVKDRGTDGPEFDIYLINLTPQNLYGVTYFPPDAYMTIDNDFESSIYSTQGPDGARVTLAHELHHAVQFAYRIINDDFFFYEATSTYFEDVVYDRINDYLQYLDDFFAQPESSFNRKDGWHEYGLSIWNHFLERRYDATVLRSIWEGIGEGKRALDAVDEALQLKNTDFETALGEFYSWNYFTGTRADSTQFYREGHLYPTLMPSDTVSITSDTTITITNNYLSARYIYFNNVQPARYIFRVSPDNGLDYWANNLVYDVPFGSDSILEFIPEGTDAQRVIESTSLAASIVYVPVAVARSANIEPGTSGKYSTELSLSRETTTQYDSDELLVNYPSPFVLNDHSETTIPFNLAKEGDVEVFFFTSSGRLVKKLSLGFKQTGLHPSALKWDGKDENGDLVGSGIYICQMKIKDRSIAQKIAVIK